MCEAGAEVHEIRGCITGDGGWREMTRSMRYTWSIEVVEKIGNEMDTSAAKEHQRATVAGEAIGVGTALNLVPVDVKEDGADEKR